MATTRTKSIITIVILLVLLAVLSATSALTAQIGFGRARPQDGFNGTPAPGDAQGGNGGGNFQGGNGGGFQGGNGADGGFQGRGGGGGFAGRGAFNLFGATRTLGINPRVIGYVSTGLTVLGILLALLCAFGVWKQKKWALNLGMALAVLFLLGALPGLFFAGGRFNLLRTVIPLLSVGASAVIIFLGILPSVRETVS